ncbi:Hypothetical predicted protein, partial [Marmota monax]
QHREEHHAHAEPHTTVLYPPIYDSTQTTSILGHCSHHHSPLHVVISTVGQWIGPGGSCLLQHRTPQCAITERGTHHHCSAHPSSPISESSCLHLGTTILGYLHFCLRHLYLGQLPSWDTNWALEAQHQGTYKLEATAATN